MVQNEDKTRERPICELVERLRRSEEQYRTIIDSIEDAYWEVDLSGNLTFFNDSMSRMLGRSREELAGLNYKCYVSEQTSRQAFQQFNEVYRTGEPGVGASWEIIGRDGTLRKLESIVSLIRDAEGRPIGFRGSSRDLTRQQRAEEALRASEHRFTLAFNASPVPITITTFRGGIFVDANDSFTRLSGYSREELIGRSTRELNMWADLRQRDEVLRLLEEEG